jgi:hypothetical protein
MPINSDVGDWFGENGYKHHCFVSWPHVSGSIQRFANTLREAIREELSNFVPGASVFIDEQTIPPGGKWARVIPDDLCKSISMVAVWCPIYDHPAHHWCRREWNAMELLGKERLAGENFKTIIPVLYRTSNPLPAQVDETQYIDLSHLAISSVDCQTMHYKRHVYQIAQQIRTVANTLMRKGSKARCADRDLLKELALNEPRTSQWEPPIRKELPLVSPL